MNLTIEQLLKREEEFSKHPYLIYKHISPLGISITNISNCLRRVNKSVGGFIFKYHYAS